MRRKGLTVEQAAAALEVHPQTLRQWRSREGMPGVVIGGKLSLDLDAILAWRAERGKTFKVPARVLEDAADAPRGTPAPPAAPAAPAAPESDEDIAKQMALVRLRLDTAKAVKEELNNDIKRGDFVSKDVALMFFAGICQTVRARLDVVPERLAGEVTATDEHAARAAIRAEMDSILAELPSDFSEGLSAGTAPEEEEGDEGAEGEPDAGAVDEC